MFLLSTKLVEKWKYAGSLLEAMNKGCPEIEYVVDLSAPPVGPPTRLANCFVMLSKENEKRDAEYQAYVEEYRSQLLLARQDKSLLP